MAVGGAGSFESGLRRSVPFGRPAVRRRTRSILRARRRPTCCSSRSPWAPPGASADRTPGTATARRRSRRWISSPAGRPAPRRRTSTPSRPPPAQPSASAATVAGWRSITAAVGRPAITTCRIWRRRPASIATPRWARSPARSAPADFATGPHVHFSLKYNGAYISLEGVELTGWTIHVGPVAYNSGSIERDGVSLNPWSQVLNDYHTYFGSGVDTSLQFLPGGSRRTDPASGRRSDERRPGRRWTSAPATTSASTCGCGRCRARTLPRRSPAAPTTTGRLGNILIDRRRTGGAGYGVSIAGGRVAFGVTGPALEQPDAVRHDGCHRRRLAFDHRRAQSLDGLSPDGSMWLFVDGHLEASGSRRPGRRRCLPRQRCGDLPGRSLSGSRRRQVRWRPAASSAGWMRCGSPTSFEPRPRLPPSRRRPSG